jgi:hypothetical protein
VLTFSSVNFANSGSSLDLSSISGLGSTNKVIFSTAPTANIINGLLNRAMILGNFTTHTANGVEAFSAYNGSNNLNTAAAGSNLIVGVYKNGTIINAAAIVTLASATNDVKGSGTFAQNAYTFAAGDVIDVRTRTGSGWSATAADASIAVEIES